MFFFFLFENVPWRGHCTRAGCRCKYVGKKACCRTLKYKYTDVSYYTIHISDLSLLDLDNRISNEYELLTANGQLYHPQKPQSWQGRRGGDHKSIPVSRAVQPNVQRACVCFEFNPVRRLMHPLTSYLSKNLRNKKPGVD